MSTGIHVRPSSADKRYDKLYGRQRDTSMGERQTTSSGGIARSGRPPPSLAHHAFLASGGQPSMLNRPGTEAMKKLTTPQVLGGSLHVPNVSSSFEGGSFHVPLQKSRIVTVGNSAPPLGYPERCVPFVSTAMTKFEPAELAVVSDGCITIEEFKEALARERDVYEASSQKIFQTQVEKLQHMMSLEVHNLNVRIDKLNNLRSQPEGEVEKIQERGSVPDETICWMKARIDQISAQAEKNASSYLEVNLVIDSMARQLTDMTKQAEYIEQRLQTFEANEARGTLVSEQISQFKVFADTCQVRLQKLETYEEKSAQNTLRLQTCVAELQDQAGVWKFNNEALQMQVDNLVAGSIVDGNVNVRLKVLEDGVGQLNILLEKTEKSDLEVQCFLDQLRRFSESFDERLQKLEVCGGFEGDGSLKGQVDKLCNSFDIMDVRLRELEYSRSAMSDCNAEGSSFWPSGKKT